MTHRLALGTALALLGGAWACGGCSDPPPVTQGDAGKDAAEAGLDAGKDAIACVPPPRSIYVPSTWLAWDAIAPCSGLYVPPTKSDLPAAFAWEPCGPEAKPVLAGCRRLKPIVDGGGSNGYAYATSSGDVTVLQLSGYPDGGGIARIGSADGALGAAVAWTKQNGLWYQVTLPLTQPVAESRWLLEVRHFPDFAPIGYVAGQSDRPDGLVAQHFDSIVRVAYGVGEPGILRWNLGFIELLDFNTGTHLIDITTPAQNGGLSQGSLHFFGNTLTWVGNSKRTLIARRWDVGDPAPTDFIDYRPDDDHAAGTLATDGKVLVWLEGHGPEQSAFWTTADYWTAPLVKEPKALSPKRVRSELPNAVGQNPLVIGCGYVSTYNGRGIRIVRLADGYSTFLPSDPKTNWNWEDPLAISCSELFLRTGYKAETGVVRLLLTSLPFADPPD